MTVLITGGSGSGKSAYAEKLAEEEYSNRNLQKENTDNPTGKLYYIATMHIADAESEQRVKRHQQMRKDKGFLTIECFNRLERIIPMLHPGDVLLLECMSNLLANEMYDEEGRIRDREKEACKQMEHAIVQPILTLSRTVAHIVIVTNEIFSDGSRYQEDTECYVNLLGILNQRLSSLADHVVEVVCSIPVCRKGELLC
ncbi:MAG: bifunctional adenosylcobinamide kinase/adenosylcobinamide-phosphate guanylyltransferase [Lachnospiraceae bacterium]